MARLLPIGSNFQIIDICVVLWPPWPDWAIARAIEKGGHMFYYETAPNISEFGDNLSWWQKDGSMKKLCVGILDMGNAGLDGIQWMRTLQLKTEYDTGKQDENPKEDGDNG